MSVTSDVCVLESNSITCQPIAFVKKKHKGISEKSDFQGLIGRSACMLEVFEKVRKVSKRDVTVMLLGETGTGKEVIAQVIHKASKRSASV